jgi:hypothetical protein
MNLVYGMGLQITLRDKDGKEYELFAQSYNAYSDNTIEIIAQVKNSELKRGWIGDMFCCVQKGRDIVNGEIVDESDVDEVYHNILLKSVKIDSADIDEITTWKYVFEKE